MNALQYRLLANEEIDAATQALHDWTVEQGALRRSFSFETYKAGVLFAAAVAAIAEGLDHHPDMHLGYKTLSVSVSTHSVGGLSPYDVEFAKRVDEMTRLTQR